MTSLITKLTTYSWPAISILQTPNILYSVFSHFHYMALPPGQRPKVTPISETYILYSIYNQTSTISRENMLGDKLYGRSNINREKYFNIIEPGKHVMKLHKEDGILMRINFWSEAV